MILCLNNTLCDAKAQPSAVLSSFYCFFFFLFVVPTPAIIVFDAEFEDRCCFIRIFNVASIYFVVNFKY